MEYITCQEMKNYEVFADAAGLGYYQMMENAGSAAAKYILEKFAPPKGSAVAVFCGKGNNGGDGLVIARLLGQQGMNVDVILVDKIPVTEDALKNFHLLTDQIIHNSVPETLNADIVIDAIYGTGFHGDLRSRGKNAIRLINNLGKSGVPIIAIDIPSGLNGDTPKDADLSDVNCVHATSTVTFHRAKLIHQNPTAAQFIGELEVADIGIDNVL